MNTALYRFLAIAGVIFLIPISIDACSDISTDRARESVAKQHLARADQNLVDGRIAIAEAGYSAALRLNPLHPVARRGQARAQATRISIETSTIDQGSAYTYAERFEYAVEKDPEYGTTYRIALGKLYQALGKKKTALKWLTAAIEGAPENGRAWRLQGALLSETGKLDEAVESLKKSAKLDPKDGQTALLLGGIYKKQRKLPEAVKLLEEAAKTIPTATTLLELGDGLIQTNNPEKAYQTLTSALRAPGSKALANPIAATLGVAAFRTKRYPEAVQYLRLASKESPTAGVLLNLAVALQGINNHAEALKILQGLYQKQPTSVDVNIRFMMSLAQTQQMKLARQVGARYLTMAAKNPKLAAAAEQVKKLMAQIPSGQPKLKMPPPQPMPRPVPQPK